MNLFTVCGFIFLSILEATVINMLILKLYRLPFREYQLQLICLSIAIAISSFMMRIPLNLPAWDLPLQYVIFVLFYCYVLKYRLHCAAFIIGSGLSLYITTQVFIYNMMKFIGWMDEYTIFVNTGFFVNTFQLCSVIMGALIAIFIKMTDRGFSFVLPPSQDVCKVKYTKYRNLIVLVSGLMSAVILSIMVNMLLSQNYMLITFLLISNFTIAYYFSNRSEYESFRGAIKRLRKKD